MSPQCWLSVSVSQHHLLVMLLSNTPTGSSSNFILRLSQQHSQPYPSSPSLHHLLLSQPHSLAAAFPAVSSAPSPSSLLLYSLHDSTMPSPCHLHIVSCCCE